MPKAQKSRFGSVAGKKIEKEVRKYAARFGPYASSRRGHVVASGANHRGKPAVDSKIRHKSNILSNEKLASMSMTASKSSKRNVANDANRRDNVASLLVKDSNTRHMNFSTMNVSSNPSLRCTRKSNRRDDGVAYLASKPNRQNSLKDKNIKHNDTSVMDASLATLSRTANERRSVPVEANRQVSHASRPIKQDPPRKNTNTKQVEAIMPNENVARRDDSIVVLRSLEDHDPLKEKTTMNRSKNINNSQSPQFKGMAGLVHRTKNVDVLDGYNDALPSRLKRHGSLDNRGGFIVDNHSDRKLMIKATEEASPKRMKKQRNTKAKGDDTSHRYPMDEINGDVFPFGVKDYSEGNLTYGLMKKQGNMKTNEDEAIDYGDMELMEVEDGGTQLETRDCRPKNKKKRGIESNGVGDDKADDCFAKKKLESSLPKDNVSLDCTNEATQSVKLTHIKLKKGRQDIMRNEDEELHVDDSHHSPLDADDDSSRLTSQVPAPFVLEHVKKQCNYCSNPIDEPIWSGIIKIDGEKYISLAGHLSTKSCDKVWELSRSLMPIVEVTKLSRSKFKIWETSKPSCDNIGLYFFPNKMRHDEDLDKLVKEVTEDDLVLQTVIGEAEMLIFPSTVLPERYKTFQRKQYLWGVFRPRQVQCATISEPVHDAVCCAQEKDEEEQHASNQQDEVQEVNWKSPAKIMQQAAATRGIPQSPDMDFQLQAFEGQLGDALSHTLHGAEATAVATNPAAVTTETAALVSNPASLTTDEAVVLATIPAALTTEAAALAANPAAVTTEAAAVATNAAAVTTEAAALSTNAATIPAEATENETNAATIPRNHGRSDSIVGVPSGRFFYFVAGQTQKLEQLLQEMQREGSLVLAIRGEPIGHELLAPKRADQPEGFMSA